MAVIITDYKDINQTMRGIRTQVVDSLEWVENNLPKFKDPEEAFKTLKNLVTYKNDPAGIELLQSAGTLFDQNYWGIPGAGDCDCFTILVLAVGVVNGWNNQSIFLVGRSKLAPVHIYSSVKFRNNNYIMDLTNAYINVEREYKFRQELKV
jgi:hypothetical protein